MFEAILKAIAASARKVGLVDNDITFAEVDHGAAHAATIWSNDTGEVNLFADPSSNDKYGQGISLSLVAEFDDESVSHEEYARFVKSGEKIMVITEYNECFECAWIVEHLRSEFNKKVEEFNVYHEGLAKDSGSYSDTQMIIRHNR